MHHFDYSFLKNGMLPAGFINLVAEIYKMKALAANQADRSENAFTALERIATEQSVRSSNEIEGIVTTEERYHAILQDRNTAVSHSEKEIAGYWEALEIIRANHGYLDFDEKTILLLHETMMNIAGYEYAGQYKERNNDIIEEDANGYRTVRFHPTTAAGTPEAMKQLVLAYNEARNDSEINQLLLIPCVILDFLCIHPFKDGNGRISRLLSLLLLYQNQYDVCKYISLEEQINKRKVIYYSVLKKSSEGWHENSNDYTPFMIEFLTEIYMSYKELDQKLGGMDGKKATKQERIKKAVLDSLIPVSKTDICELLPDVSMTTVEAVLGKMVREGRVRKVGGGKNVQYVRS